MAGTRVGAQTAIGRANKMARSIWAMPSANEGYEIQRSVGKAA